MAAFNDKIPPAFNRGSDDYTKWKKKYNIWKTITDLEKKKQGGNLLLRLDDTTQEQVLELLTEDEISSEDGAKKIIQKLDVIFKKDEILTAYREYEDFESFKRPPEMSISEYLNEFEKRWNKTKANGTALSENVLAYRLLRSASLTSHDEQLVIATIGEFKFENMKDQLKKVVTGIRNLNNPSFNSPSIKEEPPDSETLYGKSFRGNGSKGRYHSNRRDSYCQNSERKDLLNFRKKGKNPLDQWGNMTRCLECDSVNHWVNACPDTIRKMHKVYKEEDITYESDVLFQVGLSHNDLKHSRKLKNCVGEATSAAVLDCGAEQTVCGVKWLNGYIKSLNSEDTARVITLEKKFKHVFKFGDGRKIPAIKRVIIPCVIGNRSIKIATDVIDEDIPLLLSKKSLKKGRSQIDFSNDKINILGQEVPLEISWSGHYLLPIRRPNQAMMGAEKNNNPKTILHAIGPNPQEVTHPAFDKLEKLIQWEENVKDLIEVSMASKFGETVGMDLKRLGNVYLLHLVDHATGFSSGAIIRTKQADVIIRELFKCWIDVFGIEGKFRVDIGSELNNEKFMEMCEKLNICIKLSTAESPCSSSPVKKNSQLLAEMVTQTMKNLNCSLELALMFSLNALNSLSLIKGYSPYQLVVGQNLTIPALQNLMSQAVTSENANNIIRKYCQDLHNARKTFLQKENNERIRRALRNDLYTSGDVRYITGDVVYYKNFNSKNWKGLAVVIGQDSQHVLVKHDKVLKRIPPYRLSLVKDTALRAKETLKIDNRPSLQLYKREVAVGSAVELPVRIAVVNSDKSTQPTLDNLSQENIPVDENLGEANIDKEDSIIKANKNREQNPSNEEVEIKDSTSSPSGNLLNNLNIVVQDDIQLQGTSSNEKLKDELAKEGASGTYLREVGRFQT